MKRYSYTIMLGLSLLVAGTVKGASYLEETWKVPPSVTHVENQNKETVIDGVWTEEEGKTDAESGHTEETRTESVAWKEQENTETEEKFSGVQDTMQTESGAEAQTGEENDAVLDSTESIGSQEDETEVVFKESGTEYFADALFIGDSRTVGLSEYGDLGDADVFANSGMSVFKIFETDISVKSVGKTNLENLLESKQYGKIYIMLGINEMGYPYESVVSKYQKLVDRVRALQPNALIFLQANLHVTKSKSEGNPTYSNEKIDKLNQAISQMADDEKMFYIDVNEVFDDGEGNLADEYTADNAHVLGKYYADWVTWLLTKTV